jgi:hypothetical protein
MYRTARTQPGTLGHLYAPARQCTAQCTGVSRYIGDGRKFLTYYQLAAALRQCTGLFARLGGTEKASRVRPRHEPCIHFGTLGRYIQTAPAQATVEVCNQSGSNQRAPAGVKLKSSATVRSARIAVARKTAWRCCSILLPKPCKLRTNVAHMLSASATMLHLS